MQNYLQSMGLVEYNEDMIAGFRRYVYDSPMIIFEPSNWGRTEWHNDAHLFFAVLMGILVVVSSTILIIRKK